MVCHLQTRFEFIQSSPKYDRLFNPRHCTGYQSLHSARINKLRRHVLSNLQFENKATLDVTRRTHRILYWNPMSNKNFWPSIQDVVGRPPDMTTAFFACRMLYDARSLHLFSMLSGRVAVHRSQRLLLSWSDWEGFGGCRNQTEECETW